MDRLYVIGNASGDHGVQVINQGGLGALTTGDGINLITVDGETHSGSFTMSNSVSAGAYEYFLYQIDGNRWNLQSNLINPGPGPGPGPDPEPETEPGEETAYRPEVPGYIAAPWLNAFYGFTTLGSLHERRGSAEGQPTGLIKTHGAGSVGSIIILTRAVLATIQISGLCNWVMMSIRPKCRRHASDWRYDDHPR